MSRRFYIQTPENPDLSIVKFLPAAKRSPHLILLWRSLDGGEIPSPHILHCSRSHGLSGLFGKK
ncbi:hypothetical protein IQ270_03140 [Microcoleus sp. LEGE 07076]|nr:hypothetical protein [Microcoleus sp. LEGE 07076]